MIKMLRIDERLIHGQVACTWCAHLDVDRIIVANDSAATDEVQQVALKMAAPQGVKVAIKSVADAIGMLNDPRLERFKVLVLVSNPADAVTVVEAVPEVPFVNVGNFGLIEDGKERKRYDYSVMATDEEAERFRAVVKLRPESTYQMTLADQRKMLADVF